MSRRQKPRRTKRYTPRPIRRPLLVDVAVSLRPLEELIERIAIDGTVTVEGNQTVMQADDGDWYDAAGAVEGVLSTLDMWSTRHQRALPLECLRTFVSALRANEPIDAHLLADLIEALPTWRRALATSSRADVASLVQQTNIKAALEEAEA
jgi:hypothetical protein